MCEAKPHTDTHRHARRHIKKRDLLPSAPSTFGKGVHVSISIFKML